MCHSSGHTCIKEVRSRIGRWAAKSNAAVKQLRTKEVNYKGKGVFAELIIGTSIIATQRLRDV